MKVVILLATYNSEKYLSAQLDSLLSQSYRNWNLVIKDDFSEDNTQSILTEYQKLDSRITIKSSGNVKQGAAFNFMELLQSTEADYYFFCDHDDIWLPDKMEKTLAELIKFEKQYPDLPIIVHSDLKVVNENLELIHPSFWKSSGIKPDLLNEKGISQVFNFVTGCTMCFNKKSKAVSLPFTKNIPMHDWWITLCVIKNSGKVFELEETLILYRQHSNNVVGARDVGLKYFITKIINLNTTLKNQFKHIKFLREINGIGFITYYYYKIYYTFVRKL